MAEVALKCCRWMGASLDDFGLTLKIERLEPIRRKFNFAYCTQGRGVTYVKANPHLLQQGYQAVGRRYWSIFDFDNRLRYNIDSGR